MGDEGNGFSEYRQLLLSEIHRLNSELIDIKKMQSQMLIDLARLQTTVEIRASLIGAIAGFGVSAISALFAYFKVF